MVAPRVAWELSAVACTMSALVGGSRLAFHACIGEGHDPWQGNDCSCICTWSHGVVSTVCSTDRNQLLKQSGLRNLSEQFNVYASDERTWRIAIACTESQVSFPCTLANMSGPAW
jgi:hypothetical protein